MAQFIRTWPENGAAVSFELCENWGVQKYAVVIHEIRKEGSGLKYLLSLAVIRKAKLSMS